jgi:hypothetical protein
MNEPPAPFAAHVQPKSCGLAVWSLVLGLLSVLLLVVCAGPLFAIPAVICGHLAYSRIKHSAGALEGGGMAIAGLVTGYVSIGASVLLIPLMLAIAIPNFVKARQTAQTNVCVNHLRELDAAKQQWALEKSKTAADTPTMQDLAPYLRNAAETIKCPAGGTYTLNPVGQAPACSTALHRLAER